MKIETSATVAISNEAMALRKKGIEVYDFSAGDLILQNHPLIIEAIKNLKPFSPYSPVPGLPELREEAALRYNAKPSEIIITPGGKFALFATLAALLNAGDKVIIEKPYWPSYPSIIGLAQGTPLYVDSFNAPLPKAKALILNNPNNPTGKVYDKSEIDPLLKWADDNDAFIISDEVYSHLIFTDRPYYSTPREGRTITIQSLSKNYAMAGFRVGFIIAPESIVKEILPIIGQTVTTT
ncbi:MAG: pyridoxal phosphate-dependent aminotransferase, partial [Parachlamydiaceae bacterium]